MARIWSARSAYRVSVAASVIQPAATSPSESPNTAICPCATNNPTAAVTNTGQENRRYRAAAARSGRSRSR